MRQETHRRGELFATPASGHRFSDDELFGLLDTDDPGLRGIVDAHATGRTDEARRLLVEHFRDRKTPEWFFDLRESEESDIELPLPWPHNPSLDRNTVIYRAEELLKGHVVLSESIELHLSPDFEWRNEQTTNIGVPGNSFRCGRIFFVLAFAYRYTGDRRFLDGLGSLIERWLAEWPFEIDDGFHADQLVFSRRSNFKSMPTGNRIVQWLSVLHTRAPYELPVKLTFRWIKELIFTAGVYLRYLEADYGANNHHIMRCGTMPAIAALMFPEIPAFKPLEAFARDTFAAHLERGVLDDFGYEERSVSYTAGSLQMIGTPELLYRINGRSLLDRPHAQRLVRAMMTTTRLARTSPASSAAASDGGDTTPRSPETAFVHLRIGDGEPDRDRYAAFARTSERLAALEHTDAEPFGHLDQPNLLYLPRAGYVVARTPRVAERCAEVSVCVPDGTNRVVGHSHDDTLSLLYFVDGHTVIGDPASEFYHHVNLPEHRNTPMRGYTYAAEAHNVVLPDGEADRSVASYIKTWNAPVVPVHSIVRSHADAEVVGAGAASRGGTARPGTAARPGTELFASKTSDRGHRVTRRVHLADDGTLAVVDSVSVRGQVVGEGDIPDAAGAVEHLLLWHFGYGVEVEAAADRAPDSDDCRFTACVGSLTVDLSIEAEGSCSGELARDSEYLPCNPARPDTPPPWVLTVRFSGSVKSVFSFR